MQAFPHFHAENPSRSISFFSQPNNILTTTPIKHNMLSIQQMQNFDKHAQNILGIPALILMENAGANAARIINEKLNLKNKNIIIFCGTGNNAGDGLVFARHAKKHGANVTILLIKPELRTDETKTNHNIIKNLNIPVITTIKNQNYDIAIDAILGIGLKGSVKEPYKKAIETFNNLNCTKISLDCPTGIDADTGKTCGIAIHPDITITFHDIKKGLNHENSGKIIITDIGI